MAWLRLRLRATAEEDRRGDGVATGVVAAAALGVSLVSAAILSAATTAVHSDDSLTRLAFLLAAFFLAGDFEWQRTQSHLPRGT